MSACLNKQRNADTHFIEYGLLMEITLSLNNLS